MNVLNLEFRYLGHFALRGGGEWHPGPSPKKGRDLIQYLGAYPRRVGTREQLAAAFWPELETDAVAHRVHLAASGARAYLRHVLAGYDAIHRVASGYAWSSRLTISSDVDEFLTCCRSGTPDALRSAVALYGGAFLAGELAEWLQPLRIRCATAYECALERLAEFAAAGGDHASALSYGLQLVDTEPAHEGATRLVMRSFAALGQRHRALERFDGLREYLRKHLGVEPTDETSSLALLLAAQPHDVSEALAAAPR
jgi:DNA-binding SARP family transcriptional activator